MPRPRCPGVPGATSSPSRSSAFPCLNPPISRKGSATARPPRLEGDPRLQLDPPVPCPGRPAGAEPEAPGAGQRLAEEGRTQGPDGAGGGDVVQEDLGGGRDRQTLAPASLAHCPPPAALPPPPAANRPAPAPDQ